MHQIWTICQLVKTSRRWGRCKHLPFSYTIYTQIS